MVRNGVACRPIWFPGGERRRPSSAGANWVCGNGFSSESRSVMLNWAWLFLTERRSGHTTKRREQERGDLEHCATCVKRLTDLVVWHQGLRDHRRRKQAGQFRSGARSGSRTIPDPGPGRIPARRSQLDCRRQRLRLAHFSPIHLGPRSTASAPVQEQRSACGHV